MSAETLDRADGSEVEHLFARVAAVAAVVAAMAALGVGAGGATAAGNPTRSIAAEDQLESQILVALNAKRRALGLVSLKLSAGLSAAADAHSHSMATYGFFGHESRDGRGVLERVRPYYGRGSKRWIVGENLLWSSPMVDAQEAMEMWTASPGHRRNMLAPTWREIGLSAVSVPVGPGVFGGLGVVIVTTTFGARW